MQRIEQQQAGRMDEAPQQKLPMRCTPSAQEQHQHQQQQIPWEVSMPVLQPKGAAPVPVPALSSDSTVPEPVPPLNSSLLASMLERHPQDQQLPTVIEAGYSGPQPAAGLANLGVTGAGTNGGSFCDFGHVQSVPIPLPPATLAAQLPTEHTAPTLALEPAPAPAPAPAPEEALSISDIKRQLHALYTQHCPEKAGKKKINALVAMFKGREMHLLRQVQTKYGIFPKQSQRQQVCQIPPQQLRMRQLTAQQQQKQQTSVIFARMQRRQQEKQEKQEKQEQQEQRRAQPALIVSKNEAERNRLAIEAKFMQQQRNKQQANCSNKKPAKGSKGRKGGKGGKRKLAKGASSGENINVNMASPIKNKMSPMEVRTEVLRFYNRHNKAKLKHIDMIMTAYEGRGEELLQQLREKYEPNNAKAMRMSLSAAKPTPGREQPPIFLDFNDENSNARSANTSVSNHAAMKSGDILSSANGGCSSEEVIPVQLTPEQQQEALDKRIALLEFTLTFYSHYNANNIANVDQIVDLYVGKEEELLLNLQQKYGLMEAPTLDWRPPEPVAAPEEDETQQERSDDTSVEKAKSPSLPAPLPVCLSPLALCHEGGAEDETDAVTVSPGQNPDNWVPKTTVMESKPKSIFTLFKSRSAKSKEFFVAGETTEENTSFGIFRRRASSSSETAVIVHL
jgi:hypothetical protein